jgi:hypothetical protein
MRLFTRTVHFAGPALEVAAYAAEMRAYVAGATGVDVGLWNVQFGAPLGTMVYSARVDGLAQLTEINDTLIADPVYHEKLAQGADYVNGPTEDALAEPLHGGEGDAPVGTVITATRAVMIGGRYTEALAWGVEMAIHSEKVTGYPVGFFLESFGTFGSVAWIGGAPDAAAADAAGSALNADAVYLEKLGDVGQLFVPMSGSRTMATRVA